eukprot:3375018-Rhodomonas_salina.1
MASMTVRSQLRSKVAPPHKACSVRCPVLTVPLPGALAPAQARVLFREDHAGNRHILSKAGENVGDAMLSGSAMLCASTSSQLQHQQHQQHQHEHHSQHEHDEHQHTQLERSTAASSSSSSSSSSGSSSSKTCDNEDADSKAQEEVRVTARELSELLMTEPRVRRTRKRKSQDARKSAGQRRRHEARCQHAEGCKRWA